jgi:hypothetical protein
MSRPKIIVGSLVALKTEPIHQGKLGEFGVCYRVSQPDTGPVYNFIFGNPPVYSFMFEGGLNWALSPEKVRAFLDVTGHVSRHVAGYQFSNNEQVFADYDAGKFDAAFDEGYAIAGIELWPEARADEPATTQQERRKPERNSEPDIDR